MHQSIAHTASHLQRITQLSHSLYNIKSSYDANTESFDFELDTLQVSVEGSKVSVSLRLFTSDPDFSRNPNTLLGLP